MPGLQRDEPDEETALLSTPLSTKRSAKREPTPLPKLQISILLILQLAEPITSQCIYPFINQLVSELDITGGDEAKVGYYAGLIESIFFATEALFVLQWSRISDHIGRKPVLLIGLTGLCISMVCFGLSKTFTGLVISRCIVGMLNGNTGVIKSMMAELTDSTNMAQGIALMPVVWSAGVTIGPFMGGTLAKPHDRWPNVFTNSFWIKYPYFLPCAAASLFSLITLVVTAAFLKETVKKRSKRDSSTSSPSVSQDGVPQDEVLPMRAILVPPVLISVANYALLAIMDIAYRAIQPLFYSTPIELGGLGLSPASIGMAMGAYGIMNGILQALFFARLVRRWGPKVIFCAGMLIFIPLFAMFPVINVLARQRGLTHLVWAVVAFQLALAVPMDMAFGVIFMYVSTSAPNKRSLGATNGIAQLAAAIVRSVGPASATSLFALSVQHNWLGGYAVYAVLMSLASLTLFVANRLPRQVWPRHDDIL